MTIEKLDGTSPRLYTLVAPLVMRRSVLRQNNNYPFWTSRAHTWFVAWEGQTVFGFMPVEITDGGVAKINNYYVSGDDPQLLSRFLREIIRYYHRDYTIRSVTLLRHAEVFRTEGFVPTKEWTQYVTMQYGKNGSHERLRADTAAVENGLRPFRQHLRLLFRRQGQRRAAQPLHRLHPASRTAPQDRRIPHGLRNPVPRHARLCRPDAGRERRYSRCLPGLRAVQGPDLHLDVPAVLAAVGGVEAGDLGAGDARRISHAARLPVLHRRNVGLRIPEPLRRMAPRTQRRGAYMLSDRHPHAGELQPLAHDIQRPQPPPVRRKTVDTAMGTAAASATPIRSTTG